MPTPAKLACAILFAALSWWTAETIVREALPEGVRVGRFREWVALAGLLIGWKMIGRTCSGPMNKGTTITVAITAGIGGALVLTVGGVILQGFVVMIIESLDRKYTEVGQAATAWMEYTWDNVLLIADPIILGTLYGGAAVVGLIGGIVGRVTR
ncbi:TrgA family protein [Jannaschia sp. 2305UL9-9]|uniref:TrgA family protein n=1 Tax=Jannaschia sp. 2305UL9-9 TaxID=3121638 RepID=UPI00352779CB